MPYFSLQLLDFCSIIAHMLGMNMPVSMPSCEVIKRLEVLIHSCHHFPLGNQCVVPYVPHHMALIPDAPVCSITIASSPGPEAPVQPPLPTTTTTWAAMQQSYMLFTKHYSRNDLRALVINQVKYGADCHWINYNYVIVIQIVLIKDYSSIVRFGYYTKNFSVL